MSRIFLLAMAAQFISAPMLLAQGGTGAPIKATTKLRPDNTKAVTVVNPDAHTAEETISDASDKVLKRKKFTLNERSLPVEAIYMDAKGNIRYKERMKYDESDQIIESLYYSAANAPLGKRLYFYKGTAISQTEDYDAKGDRIISTQPVKAARPDRKKSNAQPVRR